MGLLGLLEAWRRCPPIDDDEAAEPYPPDIGSIESLLAVLGRRAVGREVVAVGRDEEDDETEATDLEPRVEVPRLLL